MKKRINALANYISPYKKIADIGCDHGYLILEAFKLGITYAQAIDNKLKPLEIAKKNLSIYENQIDFMLSNGLDDLKEEVEVVIIAGMGGVLIESILQNNFQKLVNVKRIIIQANKNHDLVRKFMVLNGFYIVSEKIIFEDGIYYEISVFEHGYKSYTNVELKYGPILLKKKDKLFLMKWQDIVNKLRKINTKETLKKAQSIESEVLK